MTNPEPTDLDSMVRLLSGRDFWRTETSETHGVVGVTMADGPHGLRHQSGEHDHLAVFDSDPATCFPPAVAVGSSWDPAVAARVGSAIGKEARAAGVHVVLGPGVNMKRNPRCGRNFEYYSEDPHHTGVLAEAFVDAMQREGVGACVKHFAANNQETDRQTISAEVDERTLREIYLPAFERVVKGARPATVMAAYNKVNGTFASEHDWLLTTVLRDEWGYDGVTVSDWNAVVDRVAALVAGLDLEMPGGTAGRDGEVAAALRAGTLEEGVVHRAIERLRALGTRWGRDEAAPAVDLEAQHDIAREVAAECPVLLRNEDHLLPLAGIARVAVIGALAADPRIQGGGSSHVNNAYLDVPLTEIRMLAAERAIETAYAEGYRIDGRPDDALVAEATSVAAQADVAIVFAGLPERIESEGLDRDGIDLPADQVAVIRAAAATGTPLVVVLVHGGVVSLEPWHDETTAVLDTFLLGQGGGRAIAELLFGVAVPSGKLAETIPFRVQDHASNLNFPGEQGVVRYGEGVFMGYRQFASTGTAVRYPFGHGLSYTTFVTRSMTVTPTGADSATVGVEVENTGSVAGKHVVQVYVSTTAGPVARPVRELRAFTKVHLAPGEATTVTFDLDRRAFAYWDVTTSRWTVAPGDYGIEVCADAHTVTMAQSVSLSGDLRNRPVTMDSKIGDWFDHPVIGDLTRDALGFTGSPITPEQLAMVASMTMRQFVNISGLDLPVHRLEALAAETNPERPASPDLEAYRNADLHVTERVADLLGRMTLTEKAAQLVAPFGAAVDVFTPPAEGFGTVVAGIASLGVTPREAAARANELQRFHVEQTRLGIPVLFAEEALLGLKIQGAVTFPDAIAQAATWDPDLITEMATVIGDHMTATGVRQALSPLADVAHDPRWGRVEETYGEDPYLVALMATAFVRGLQGDGDARVIATLKHFLGYSASVGGRNTDSTAVGPRELREVHATAFEMAIRDGGARGVMPSYTAIDGEPVTGSPGILTDLLRDELGFDGLVISDLGAVAQLHNKHQVAPTPEAAQARAVSAGVHVDLDNRVNTDRVVAAVTSGELPESDLDTAVAAVLAAKFSLGLFEDPYIDLSAVPESLDGDHERELARTIAEKSITLLQNRPAPGASNAGPLLPLPPDTRRIAVIGPNAHRLMGQLGNYSYQVLDSQTRRFALAADPTARPEAGPQARGADDAELLVESVPVVTFLDGIRRRVPDAEVRYESGCPIETPDRSGIPAAVAAAQDADVAIVVIGDQAGINGFGTVGEGLDSLRCELPGVQRELVEAIAATGTPTVAVLSHGRPFAMRWLTETVPAIVTTWFGGEEAGNALASVLFGDVNPGGRVPVSFLDSAGAAPLPYWRALQRPGYVDGDGGAVFPFGHGLSYTTFTYSDLVIQASEVATDGTVELSFTVTNTGDRTGDEVVQVYGQDTCARTVRPARTLLAFRRVCLEPSAAARVTVRVPVALFALWDNGWLVEPGEVVLFVGGSSAHVALRTSVDLTGDTVHLGANRPLASTVEAVVDTADQIATLASAQAAAAVAGKTQAAAPPLTAESTVLEWLSHPVGGPAMRGLLGDIPEDMLKPAFGLPLTTMAMYSGGAFTEEMVSALLDAVGTPEGENR